MADKDGVVAGVEIKIETERDARGAALGEKRVVDGDILERAVGAERGFFRGMLRMTAAGDTGGGEIQEAGDGDREKTAAEAIRLPRGLRCSLREAGEVDPEALIVVSHGGGEMAVGHIDAGLQLIVAGGRGIAREFDGDAEALGGEGQRPAQARSPVAVFVSGGTSLQVSQFP